MSNSARWIAGTLVLAMFGISAGQACDMRGGHGGEHGMAMLKQADANKDGVTTIVEMQAKVLEHATAMDSNKDGAVTSEEVGAFRTQMRAERRAAHFQTLDTDKDGKVSVQEFAAAHGERMAQWDRNKDGVLDAKDHRDGGDKGHHGGEHH